MARKKEESEETVQEEVDSIKLSRLLIKEFNKDEDKRGKMAWCLASDLDCPTDVKEFIGTGSTLLNYTISNRRDGGIPVGKVTEITGEEASGKSLLCAHIAAECQKRGGIVVYIDSENAANPDFLRRVGVNISELVYLQPGTLEEVGEAIEKTITMVRTRAPNKLVVVIYDSAAASPTKAEVEGSFDLSMDLQLAKSKLLSKMMRKITDMIGKERIALVITNQLKIKIGVMYGDPMTTPGGKAIGYHASVRIRLFAGQKKKVEKKGGLETGEDAGDIYGIHTSSKIIKNRIGPPWRKCEFDILFASGIDDEGSWFQRLHECGEIEKNDGWCYLSKFPSGRLDEKGAYAGKDRGLKFRERALADLVKSDPNVKKFVLDLLEKNMIVKYGEAPKDAELDTESLLEVESAIQVAVEQKS
jgi:recombination protein RecA